MKPGYTVSAWSSNPPSDAQASKIVSHVSMAGALILGLIGFEPLIFGGSFGYVNLLFVITATHLLIQAVASAISWRLGAAFAVVSMAAMFVVVIGFLVQFDLKTPAVFGISVIVSGIAVKIWINHAKRTIRG